MPITVIKSPVLVCIPQIFVLLLFTVDLNSGIFNGLMCRVPFIISAPKNKWINISISAIDKQSISRTQILFFFSCDNRTVITYTINTYKIRVDATYYFTVISIASHLELVTRNYVCTSKWRRQWMKRIIPPADARPFFAPPDCGYGKPAWQISR
jgi:hypothetical protein